MLFIPRGFVTEQIDGETEEPLVNLGLPGNSC